MQPYDYLDDIPLHDTPEFWGIVGNQDLGWIEYCQALSRVADFRPWLLQDDDHWSKQV